MRILVGALLAVLAVEPVLAADTKPTEESVSQLFEAMHTSQVLESYVEQLDTAMRTSMRQAVQGTPLNAEQQQIMDDMGSEVVSLLKHEMNWDSLRPKMIEVYRDTFSQHEVDEMLKFYRSPTGQAVISKLPAAMRQSMQAMQEHLKALTPKLMQLQKDTLAALRRAQSRPADSAESPQSSQPPGAEQPPAPQTPKSARPPPAPQPR